MAPRSRLDSSRAFLRDGLRNRLVWLAFAVGLASTAASAMLAVDRARQAAERDFQQQSQALVAHVTESFRAPLEALHGIHALNGAWPEVDQRRFELFAGKLLDRYPSLAALELFDVVEASDRAAFERRVSAQSGVAFAFREPAPAGASGMMAAKPRERHVVLTRLLPFREELYGLDLMFDPLRRGQVEAAARAATPLVTGKFRLVEDPEGVYSVAVYYPLYHGGQVPADPEQRLRAVRGFAIALYRLSPLMRAALRGTAFEAGGARLLDREPGLPAGEALLFGAPAAPSAGDLQRSHELRFAGRAWSIETSRAAPAALTGAGPSLLVGGMGSALVALLAALATSLRRSRQRVEALQELGPYRLLREVGVGGMGRVFEARHSLLRRRAAIKVVAQARASEEQLRRFDLEAKMTSELCHPNTVVVFDYGRTRSGDFYYAMEYVNGVDLDRLVRQYGAQPAARVRHLLVQACGSLSEAHGLGLVHRDVKPGNVMVGVIGGVFDFVKVLDFGLVRVTRGAEAGKSGPGHLLGTPRYMAPECFASSQTGPRADIYALGSVAYFLLAGQAPFEAKTDAGIAAMHLTQSPAPLQGRGVGDVTPELEKIVLRCLAKKPDARFSSMAQLMRALNELDLPPWTQADAAAFWAEHAAGEDARAAQRAARLEV